MTISSETRTAGPFTGNGVTTAFPFTFKVFSTSDVLVVQTDTSGVESTLVLTTNYTVSLNADQNASPGGTVTTNSAVTSGYLLTLTSRVGNTQSVALTNQGGFYPAVINAALDRAVILIQQLLNKVNRSIKIPLSDGTALTTELPTAGLRANKALIFDEDGNIDISADDFNDQAANAAASAAAAASSASAASSSASAASSSASAASSSASAASSSASAASTSAAAAAASVAAGIYDAAQNKSANFNIVLADEGDLFRVDTSGGSVIATLDTIANLGDFKVAVAKITGDGNTVTITRGGSNTINGSTTYVLDSAYETVTLISKSGTTDWLAVGGGASASNFSNPDVFSGNGSTTAFTLSRDPGSENNLLVAISGVLQQRSVYSVSGTTLTFSTAPPSASNNVEVSYLGGIALDIGTPSDSSVTNAKLASMAANTVKANATAGSAAPTDVALAASQLLGRGSSGNIAPITLSGGLTMTAAVLGMAQAAVNVLGSDVNLNNTSNYFDGPTLNVGSTGVFEATATITCSDSVGAAEIYVKLHDGTTIVASGIIRITGAGAHASLTLHGEFTNPAGNIRISARDVSSTGGAIHSDVTGNAKDSTIRVKRVG